MKTTPDRDLLVLLKSEFMSRRSIEQEVECLNEILLRTERPDAFCKAHELVVRNKITQKSSKLLVAFNLTELKPFWFLISRN